ncbi:MAG: hypothetical protein ACT4PT_11040 [Methanobacteriota archaeon]
MAGEGAALAIYRAAVEGVWEAGELRMTEYPMLARLAAALDLDPREMARVERDVEIRVRGGALATIAALEA